MEKFFKTALVAVLVIFATQTTYALKPVVEYNKGADGVPLNYSLEMFRDYCRGNETGIKMNCSLKEAIIEFCRQINLQKLNEGAYKDVEFLPEFFPEIVDYIHEGKAPDWVYTRGYNPTDNTFASVATLMDNNERKIGRAKRPSEMYFYIDQGELDPSLGKSHIIVIALSSCFNPFDAEEAMKNFVRNSPEKTIARNSSPNYSVSASASDENGDASADASAIVNINMNDNSNQNGSGQGNTQIVYVSEQPQSYGYQTQYLTPVYRSSNCYDYGYSNSSWLSASLSFQLTPYDGGCFGGGYRGGPGYSRGGFSNYSSNYSNYQSSDFIDYSQHYYYNYDSHDDNSVTNTSNTSNNHQSWYWWNYYNNQVTNTTNTSTTTTHIPPRSHTQPATGFPVGTPNGDINTGNPIGTPNGGGTLTPYNPNGNTGNPNGTPNGGHLTPNGGRILNPNAGNATTSNTSFERKQSPKANVTSAETSTAYNELINGRKQTHVQPQNNSSRSSGQMAPTQYERRSSAKTQMVPQSLSTQETAQNLNYVQPHGRNKSNNVQPKMSSPKQNLQPRMNNSYSGSRNYGGNTGGRSSAGSNARMGRR